MARLRLPFLRLDRLWWWFAIISLLAVLGQGIARSSGYGIVSAAELEGFGDELEDGDDEEDARVVVPPAVHIRSGFQTDRGPPESDQKSTDRPKEFIANGKKSEVGWDDDEFEGVPSEAPQREVLLKSPKPPAKQIKPNRPLTKRPSKPSELIFEGFMVLFLLCYATNYFIGRRRNEKIALAWAQQFAAEGAVFEKNFSLLGSGDGIDEPLLMKEGQTSFKFYASGRRYCVGLLATLNLKYRHDLISLLWYTVSPKRDEIAVDVFMNDESMDPFVFAVTRRKNAKSFLKENKDLKELAGILDFSTRRKWPSDELAVLGDNREVANDLISDLLIDQLFGEKVFEKFAADFFVSMHFTDQYAESEGRHKKVLRFKFYLPQSDKMADLARHMAIIPYYIDVVGRYRLNAAACSKAEALRARLAEEEYKDSEKERMEAAMRKREEKRRAEEAKRAEIEARLSPEALARRKEKERLKLAKQSAPKMKLSRAH